MKRNDNWFRKLAEEVDLSAEPMPGLPIAELAGDRRLLIEHHQGVSAYSREMICIQVKYGSLRVCGNGLELVRMTREQLVIRGRIDAIHLIRRG